MSHYLAATISTPHIGALGSFTWFLLGMITGFIVHGKWGR